METIALSVTQLSTAVSTGKQQFKMKYKRYYIVILLLCSNQFQHAMNACNSQQYIIITACTHQQEYRMAVSVAMMGGKKPRKAVANADTFS